MDLRQEFNLDPPRIYLNSGTLSLMPRQVLEATERYRREYELNPTAELFKTWGRLWESQKALGKFLSARPEDLFLRHNVSSAMNVFIQGMPMERGEILVTDLEYGAMINACRMRAERDGMTLRSMAIPADRESLDRMTPESLVERIVSELKPETRMLMISHVMTGNSLVVPLAELARETKKRGVLLAVDGAHAPGGIPLDFSKYEDVDFYGANLHKWLLCPKGTGLGWAAPRHHDRLRALEGGWTTYETPGPFQAFGDGNRFAARMLLASCHDFSGFFAIQDALEFWNRNGVARIFERRQGLQALLEKEMREIVGWASLSPPPGELRGPLLTFEIPEPYQSMGFGFMDLLWKEHGLQVITPTVQGVSRLRLAPHIHNTEDEIRRATRILASLTR